MEELDVDEALEYSGHNSISEVAREYFKRGVVPACCECQSYVEIDGHCPHNNPSVLKKVGFA